MKLRLIALMAAGLLVLAGCGDDDPGTAGDPGTPESSAPSESGASGDASAPPADDGGNSYVALGDSYTAAPLVPDTDADDPCLRSSNNYPALVVKARPELLLTDVSCSGADSAAMIGVQQIGSEFNLPQFDSLSEATDLVTLGVGGNDFGLYSSLLADCASSSDLNTEGKPCTDAANGGATQDLTGLLPQIQDRISAVITGVKNRAPNARVLVVGYPRLVPESGRCDKLPVAEGDYDYVRALTVGLNDQLSAAASASGVDFIDIYPLSEGHDICADDPWVNGKDTDPNAALGFHPFAEEQQAVADLIVEKLGA